MCKSLIIAISPQEAAMGSIEQHTQAEQGNQGQPLSQDDINRAQNAINVLGENNPKLVEQLEKLARIKTTQPTQWNFLISILNNM